MIEKFGPVIDSHSVRSCAMLKSLSSISKSTYRVLLLEFWIQDIASACKLKLLDLKSSQHLLPMAAVAFCILRGLGVMYSTRLLCGADLSAKNHLPSPISSCLILWIILFLSEVN